MCPLWRQQNCLPIASRRFVPVALLGGERYFDASAIAGILGLTMPLAVQADARDGVQLEDTLLRSPVTWALLPVVFTSLLVLGWLAVNGSTLQQAEEPDPFLAPPAAPPPPVRPPIRPPPAHPPPVRSPPPPLALSARSAQEASPIPEALPILEPLPTSTPMLQPTQATLLATASQRAPHTAEPAARQQLKPDAFDLRPVASTVSSNHDEDEEQLTMSEQQLATSESPSVLVGTGEPAQPVIEVRSQRTPGLATSKRSKLKPRLPPPRWIKPAIYLGILFFCWRDPLAHVVLETAAELLRDVVFDVLRMALVTLTAPFFAVWSAASYGVTILAAVLSSCFRTLASVAAAVGTSGIRVATVPFRALLQVPPATAMPSIP